MRVGQVGPKARAGGMAGSSSSSSSRTGRPLTRGGGGGTVTEGRGEGVTSSRGRWGARDVGGGLHAKRLVGLRLNP